MREPKTDIAMLELPIKLRGARYQRMTIPIVQEFKVGKTVLIERNGC
jgi:riboflavin synthase